MVTYTILLLLLFAAVPRLSVIPMTSAEPITIGLLLASQPVVPGFPSMETSRRTVALALKEARARHGSSNIKLFWEETQCKEALALMHAYDFGSGKNVSVIIGPACEKSMDFVTKLMSVLKPHPVPTVTWMPRQQSQNDTAISTYWTFDKITDAFIVTLKRHSWRDVGILYSEGGPCQSLLVNINNRFPNMDLEITRNLPLRTFSDQEIMQKLQEVKAHARVILLCMPAQFLYHVLALADTLDMTAREYVYIYCRFGPYPGADLDGPMGTAKADRDRVLSPLLQMGLMSMNSTAYSQFVTNATHDDNSTICCEPPDDFAMSLYNTIIGVCEILSSPGSNLTLSALKAPSVNHDLAGLFRTITLYHYQSGGFQPVAHVTGSYNHVADIVWPTGTLPPDLPRCGFEGLQCAEQKDEDPDNAAIIGSCVSIVVVIVAVVGLYIYYRRSQLEKELISMIWKVKEEDIKMRRPRLGTQGSVPDNSRSHTPPAKKKFTRADTRGTLGFGSTSSIDKTVLFAQVGCYKGSIVTVKNIQRRSIPLTREMLRDLKTLRELQHENLNAFIGISLEPNNSYILTKYCSKGSLQDVLDNDDIKLDKMFQMSFLMDLARGLDFLHKSAVKSHGNLKSRNCVIDSRWVLKITDFGAIVVPTEAEQQGVNGEQNYYARLLWTAPELLRLQKWPPKGTQKGDVFSFAIIMQEILLRSSPYYFNNAPSDKYIINRLRMLEEPPYRPKIPDTADIPERLRGLMTLCWHKNTDLRPDAHTLLKTLIDINGRRKINIMDNMIKMLEAYSNNLEELVAERTEELALEKQKTDRLLYQMLPPLVAEQLKSGEHVVPETFSESSLFFSDIVGFTSISSESSPLQVIDLLNDLYTTFDEVIGWHDVYKVETIGDAYMVASGIPRRNGKRHAGEIANMALDLLSVVTQFRIRHMPGAKLQLRIGLHTGPCAAGVVGLTMPRYCLFGDTINMASRMESTGKAFHIHISNDMADALQALNCGFKLLERGIIEVKGKGLQKTYWLIGKKGYKKTLPEETYQLARKVEEAESGGRPLSPTDTHISTGSHNDAGESTSMYGNIFRRASFAVRFIKKLSQNSRDNSPNGSKLSVRESGSAPTDEQNYSGKTLNIPRVANGHCNNVGHTFNTHSKPEEKPSDESSPSVSKKKKKKRKKSKKSKHETRQTHEDASITADVDSPSENIPPSHTALNIPVIEITPHGATSEHM